MQERGQDVGAALIADRQAPAAQQPGQRPLHLAKTEEAEARDRATGIASLFDLRMVIGGLLALYGVT